MRYYVRRAVSVVIALSVLGGLPIAGGAWLSGGEPQPTEATASVPTASAAASLAPAATSPSPDPATDARPINLVPSYQFTTAVPDPDAAGSVTEWVCEVDGESDRCLPVKITNAIPAAERLLAEATSGTTAATTAPPAAPLKVEIPAAPHFGRFIPLDPQSAEDWRMLIELFFHPGDVNRAVDVVQCESQGQPEAKNPRSTASGLFQHLASYWPERAVKAGYGGTDVFDPVANTAVAAWLVYEGGGWQHWNASRDCWG